jgi:hypothetical protein
MLQRDVAASGKEEKNKNKQQFVTNETYAKPKLTSNVENFELFFK